MAETCPIYIWINEERLGRLSGVGLADMTRDALAGMRVLQLSCSREQTDRLLKLYPMAKYDSATTKSIELLPPEVKEKLFDMVVEKKSLDVVGEYLEGAG
jgi:hypothetical protein